MAQNGRSETDMSRPDGAERAGDEEGSISESIKKRLRRGRPKILRVRFVARDGGDYEMWQDGRQVDRLVFNKDNHHVGGDRMKVSDHFVVEFSLDDETAQRDLEVPPNPMNAIWISTPRNSNPVGCPEEPKYDQEIYALRTDPARGTLDVRNEDMQSENFQFTLRFLRRDTDPGDPGNYVNYDPSGENQNGGAPLW